MPVRRLEIRAFGGPEVIQLVEDAALPQPGPGEVRVRVEASSLAFTDTLIRRNLYPVLKPTLPLTLGYDFVGRIDAIGPGVTQWRIGERVADLTQTGGNATHLMRPAAQLVPVPQGLEATRAEPLVLTYLTAFQALFRLANAKPGESVLIYGASGAVGLAALDLCRAFGLPAVGIASARRKQAVTAMGATFVAYDETDAAGKLDRLARDANGFKTIIDAARGEPLASVLARLAPDGRLVALGFSALLRGASTDGSAPPGLLTRSRIAFEFLRIKWLSSRTGRSRRVLFYNIAERRSARPDWFQDDLWSLFTLLEHGRISPHVQRVFGLNAAVEAHRLIEAGQVEGRLVLDLASPITSGAVDGRHCEAMQAATAPMRHTA